MTTVTRLLDLVGVTTISVFGCDVIPTLAYVPAIRMQLATPNFGIFLRGTSYMKDDLKLRKLYTVSNKKSPPPPPPSHISFHIIHV